MTDTTRSPVLHGTYFDRGTGCSYTGPNDDEHCGATPVMHVCAGDEPDLLPSSLPACIDHVSHAVVAAGTRPHWTAHPYGEGCAAKGEATIITGGCNVWRHATSTSPTVRCADCGHWDTEHGLFGCAADDEAAMGGCTCTTAL